MATSIFDDKSKEPTMAELYEVLGDAADLLQDIERHLRSEYGELTYEWKFYSKKAGWTLALARKRRRLCHLIPQSGFCEVVFTLGRRAVLAAQASDLPDRVLSALTDAREYAEGRSIRIVVEHAEDVTVVKRLIAVKMAH